MLIVLHKTKFIYNLNKIKKLYTYSPLILASCPSASQQNGLFVLSCQSSLIHSQMLGYKAKQEKLRHDK